MCCSLRTVCFLIWIKYYENHSILGTTSRYRRYTPMNRMRYYAVSNIIFFFNLNGTLRLAIIYALPGYDIIYWESITGVDRLKKSNRSSGSDVERLLGFLMINKLHSRSSLHLPPYPSDVTSVVTNLLNLAIWFRPSMLFSTRIHNKTHCINRFSKTDDRCRKM